MNYNAMFNELAKNNSRLFKEAYLEKHVNDNMLVRIISMALNPFLVFYIRKIPPITDSFFLRETMTLEDALDNLSKLSDRVITGNAAISFLTNTLECVSKDDAEVIIRIIKKDLKCGVNTSTVNKIWPGLIPEYPVQLCSQFDSKTVSKIKLPAGVQLKEDGMRFNAIVREDSIEYHSRKGQELDIKGVLDTEFKILDTFINDPGNPSDNVFDGELLVLDENGNLLPRKESNGILNKANKGTITEEEASRIVAVLWDVIPLDDFYNEKCSTPYSERFSRLIYLSKERSDYPFLKLLLVPHQMVDTLEEAEVIFNDYLKEGKEGIILKDMSAGWEAKRTKTQVKFKAEKTCELRVKGWKEGTGKNIGLLGALECESEDGVIGVSVGSGFNDLERKTIKEDIIDSIIEINYNERIKNAKGEESLFLPVFVKIRLDKDKADYSKDIK